MHWPFRFLRRLTSEPMLLANLRIYFADFPECTFLYVPEHFMLGDLMRWWVRSAKGILVVVFFFFDPRTPQVFALMRITHNNDSMKVSCIFQSRAPSPNNAKSIEALAPTKVRGVDYGEKRAHRGRIDLSPGKLKCISTQFTNDYLLYNYLLFFCFCSPVQFLFGIWSQVLCCPISIVSRTLSPKGKRPEHLHFPNKTNCRCAQIPNNSCTSAVGTKSFPAPVSNIACSN